MTITRSHDSSVNGDCGGGASSEGNRNGRGQRYMEAGVTTTTATSFLLQTAIAIQYKNATCLETIRLRLSHLICLARVRIC